VVGRIRFAFGRFAWPRHRSHVAQLWSLGGFARMKKSAKVLHLCWAGGWSLFLLWISLSQFSWSWLQAEPQFIMLPLLALGWLTFGIGLLFHRSWAWYGSFVYSVISLFVAFYILWADIPIVQGEGRRFFWQHQAGSFYCEVVGAVLAVTVVSLLLHSRQHFLRRHEPAT
jgi:hypothetical protein